jgi:hypothetical protein
MREPQRKEGKKEGRGMNLEIFEMEGLGLCFIEGMALSSCSQRPASEEGAVSWTMD